MSSFRSPETAGRCRKIRARTTRAARATQAARPPTEGLEEAGPARHTDDGKRGTGGEQQRCGLRAAILVGDAQTRLRTGPPGPAAGDRRRGARRLRDLPCRGHRRLHPEAREHRDPASHLGALDPTRSCHDAPRIATQPEPPLRTPIGRRVRVGLLRSRGLEECDGTAMRCGSR